MSAQDNNRGEYGVVDYTLQTDKNFKATDYFEINQSTGQITTTKVLDRLDEALYSKMNLFITAVGTDRGQPPLSDFCTFRLTIEDVNDNSPIFSSQDKYTQSILATDGPNFHVISVLATDMDYGNNARVTYSLIENPGNYFTIGQNGGIFLTTSVPITFNQVRKL